MKTATATILRRLAWSFILKVNRSGITRVNMSSVRSWLDGMGKKSMRVNVAKSTRRGGGSTNDFDHLGEHLRIGPIGQEARMP